MPTTTRRLLRMPSVILRACSSEGIKDSRRSRNSIFCTTAAATSPAWVMNRDPKRAVTASSGAAVSVK